MLKLKEFSDRVDPDKIESKKWLLNKIRTWAKDDIVMPENNVAGSGSHARYDDVSLVALALALELMEMKLTVSHYRIAFMELQVKLRAQSGQPWGIEYLFITKNRMLPVVPGQICPSQETGVLLNFGKVLNEWLRIIPHNVQSQMSIFPSIDQQKGSHPPPS